MRLYKIIREMGALSLAPFLAVFFHQQLLKEFVSRDIKGRFAGSFGGILWTVINPVATIISYFFVFSLVLRVNVTVEETGTDVFVLFFLSGFFPWIMFADSLTKSVVSILEQSSLITKVVFPVELLPVSKLLSVFFINGIGFLIFLIYLAFSGYFNITWCFIPLIVAIEALFALGLSFFLAAFCVFIRDTSEILNITTMLWFFCTPVIYPESMVPVSIRDFMGLNPMALFAQCFRDILLIHQLNWHLVLNLLVVAVVFFIPGAWFFMRSKPAFGDVL